MKEPQKGTSDWEKEVLLQVVSTEFEHSFSDKTFSDNLSESPLLQLRPFPFVVSPGTGQKRPNHHLTTTSLQVLVRRNSQFKVCEVTKAILKNINTNNQFEEQLVTEQIDLKI